MNIQWYEEKFFARNIFGQFNQVLNFSHDPSTFDAHGIKHLIKFQIHLDYINPLFYNRNIKRYGVYVFKQEVFVQV